ncbi:regulatory protein RecX [Micavibrio aeruginosavorus]|uniref:Regulatory protein RecX n=1 Tax=Micavibrio aeruginosavorus EPB TaxID=349215 RepID=M4VED0_9BACT|nr:RecX family transcriptional regulator [Micavibrio aeruginosavorus]AGH97732.1 Regulatory protein RecX [Micavibrio aeruginosavorus EPB]
MKSNADHENIKPSAPESSRGKRRSEQAKQGPRPPKKVTPEYLRNSGLYYLQRFASSTAHFRSVMVRKIDRSCRAHADLNRDECLQWLDSMIEDFIRQGLLNDHLYAEGAVNSLRRRGLSRRAIMNRLQVKGLDGETVNALLATHDAEQTGGVQDQDAGDLHAALKLARRKRIGPFATPGKDVDRDKAIAAMGRAGFSYDIARRIMDMTPDDLNDQDLRRI